MNAQYHGKNYQKMNGKTSFRGLHTKCLLEPNLIDSNDDKYINILMTLTLPYTNVSLNLKVIGDSTFSVLFNGFLKALSGCSRTNTIIVPSRYIIHTKYRPLM